jgi:hypothetical protein
MPQRRYFVEEDDPLGRLARKINIKSAITKEDVVREPYELVMDENKNPFRRFSKQSLIHSD